ncbi:hypothetical protein FQZ97_1007180 [compost metagenome]
MVDHLLYGDGEGGLVSGHDIRGRITHQDHLYTGGIHQFGHGEIIRRKTGDLLALLFELAQGIRSYSFDFRLHTACYLAPSQSSGFSLVKLCHTWKLISGTPSFSATVPMISLPVTFWLTCTATLARLAYTV